MRVLARWARAGRGVRAFGLLALLLAWGAPAGAQDKSPIVVGVLMPITGQVAAYGQMGWDGIKLAHQMQPTVLGRPVKLVLVDNKSDNVEAANGTSRLIKKEKVVAILGPATSSKALAAAPIAEKAGVPMISSSATNPIVTQNKQYVFRVCFIDPFQGQVAARYAYNHLKARKAAVLIDVSQDYAVGLAAYFMREFKRLGGEIAVRAKCNTGDQDFSAQLGTVKSSGADLLYLPNYYTEDALVARQARELGLGVPMLSGDGAQAPELIKIGGPAVEGFSFTAHFHREGATSQVALGFLKVYDQARAQGKLGEDLTGFHVLGADTYLVLLDAIKRAGSTQGDKLRAALASTSGFVGVSGKINIGPDGNAVKSATILKVAGGKFAYVTTLNP